ncbi:MAG: DMT family transporter [Candidatus Woesebacteria bacterium]|jgi:drug/metabolite transporter (DMT)-like permease
MTSYRIKAYIYLTIVAVIWGVATPVIKYTLQGITPLSFLTYRFAISSVVAVVLIFFSRDKLSKIFDNFWEATLYSFITTTFALGILFFGIEKTTVLDAALITAVGPLVIALAGVYLLKEHITHREKLGITLAFTGTLVTVLEPILSGNFNTSQLSGNLFVVAYIFITAASSVLSKKLVRKDVDPLTLTNYSFIIGFVTLIPLALVEGSFSNIIVNIESLTPSYHLGVWYMAILSGTTAYALWVRGQKSIEISEAGLFAYLTPLFSTPLAVLWLDEQITAPFIVGAILITLGVVTAEYKKRAIDRK